MQVLQTHGLRGWAVNWSAALRYAIETLRNEIKSYLNNPSPWKMFKYHLPVHLHNVEKDQEINVGATPS